MKRVIVIGGGASGMCAAITAAQNGAEVTVLEKGEAPLKKLSMTGNGRCNLSNTDMRPDCYNEAAAKRFHALFSPEGVETVIAFFRELGVLVRSEEGYLYPVSGQAVSVVNALLTRARVLGVKVVCGVQGKEILCCERALRQAQGPRDVAPAQARWEVRGVKGGEAVTYAADAVILSSGAMSGPKSTLSTGDGYYMAEQLSLHVTKRCPALVKLRSDDPGLPEERGVRMWGNISFLTEDETRIAEEYGEIQITKGSLSGIPVLQASAAVARAMDAGKKVHAVIDFFVHIDRRRQVRPDGAREKEKDEAYRQMSAALYGDFVDEYVKQIQATGADAMTVGEALNGLCNAYINEMILRREGLEPDTPLSKVPAEQLKRILMCYRALRIDVSGIGAYTDAQATDGGIVLGDVDDTLQAKEAPGLYLTGELLDVTGRCGGYNLHWAFLSGMIAGEAAAKEKE